MIPSSRWKGQRCTNRITLPLSLRQRKIPSYRVSASDIPMTQHSIKKDLTNSIYDGIFASMFVTFTGGVFLTGFALSLGMNELMIGFLAALPFLVTIFQLPTSYLIEKSGRRKDIARRAAAVARLIWVPILILGVLPFLSRPTTSVLVISLIFLSYTFVTISYVS
jgi:hypothetical protein